MIGRRDVTAAAERIAGRVRRTPSLRLDGETVLKLEHLQHTGSFKARGAFNVVLGAERVPETGLVAASGGNHALAVAHVARELGLPVEVFVPEVCPTVKRQRIAALGATVVVGGAIYDDAQAACHRRAAETGALVVHPFDHPATVAGAGTVALELWEDEPELDTVLVAVGGGGLLGGTLAWFGRGVKVIAVEPQRSASLHLALRAGSPVEVEVAGVAADSLGARQVGELAYQLAAAHLAVSLTVTDEDIIEAQRQLWERARVVVEPGGATAYAALVGGAYRPVRGERVGVVVCGANVDPASVVRPS